jgi:hypothetical protein
MAIYIKPVPTLHGRVAERFNRIAAQNATEKRASIDFTKQVKIARAILEKSKLNK